MHEDLNGSHGVEKDQGYLYLSNIVTRFTKLQCTSVGLCINCDSLLTVNATSGIVRERYCIQPIIFLYSKALNILVPSVIDKEVEDDMSVETYLAVAMAVLSRRSRIYFCCDNRMPFLVGKTTTPRIYRRSPESLRMNLADRSRTKILRNALLFHVSIMSST